MKREPPQKQGSFFIYSHFLSYQKFRLQIKLSKRFFLFIDTYIPYYKGFPINKFYKTRGKRLLKTSPFSNERSVWNTYTKRDKGKLQISSYLLLSIEDRPPLLILEIKFTNT